MIKIITKTPQELEYLGSRMAQLVLPGDFLALDGDLGAGKTTFTKGIGKALGIGRVINSPTFNIVKCYFDSLLPLYHIDAYRLEDLHQDLGLEEYIEGDGVCLIEWAEFIKEVIPDELLKIEIEILENEERVISITPVGNKYIELLKVVKELWDIR